MGNLSTPDVTLSQILAAIQWIVGQAVIMGLVDNDQSTLVLQIGNTAISAVWVISDALIRNGRSRALINAPKPIDPDSKVNV